MRALRAGRRHGSAVHEGLVGARALVGTRYLADPSLRAEYDRDIAPRTELALTRVLREIYGPVGGPARPRRALDLGAGTGAVGRALRTRFGEAMAIVAVDSVGAPGVVQVDLSRHLPPVDGRFELIVAAHLLNELYVDRPIGERTAGRARRVLAWADGLLATGGLIALIEPALRETSRELLAVRDHLLASGLEVVAPCFWVGPCPALARERDWCHDAVASTGAPRVDFSYLVLRRGPGVIKTDPMLFRIVSDPLPEKGRLRVYGCGSVGRHPLVRLDRHTSATNAPLARATRGDVIRVTRTDAAGDGLRVTAESIVTVIAPSVANADPSR